MRRTLTILIAVLGVTGLAGCGSLTADGGHGGHNDGGHHDGGHHDGGHHSADSPVAADAREIDIEATDFRFTPDAIELAAGEDVAIVLTAIDIEHDFVIDDVDFHVHADAGETTIGGLRIDDPGTYTAYCSVPGHRDAGMEAAVTVTN